MTIHEPHHPPVSNTSKALAWEVMSEMRELIDTELDAVCGGFFDLGKYITKAVDDAISAA